MKLKAKSLLFLCLMMLPAVGGAQGFTVVRQGGQHTDGDSIDAVRYRVTYAMKFVEDTTRRNADGYAKVEDDEMRLDIGTVVSKFYSARTAAYEQWMRHKVETGDVDFTTGKPATPNYSQVFYRNYPDGETTCFSAETFTKYRLAEPTAIPEWQLAGDTCTILGYHCAKATADFKGRHWTAWYSEDIPLDYGPWKLIGLPGLILKAADATGQYAFTAIGLENIGGREPVTLVDKAKKYEIVTQKQYDKLKRTSSFNDLMAAHGISIEVPAGTTDSEGNDVTRKLKSIPPYNPIEIAE